MQNIRAYLNSAIATIESLPCEEIASAIAVLTWARMNDKQVFVMGNGGSAATASHFACDLAKNTLAPDRPRFRVIALTDSMPLFSALANDFGYEHVFSEQLASLVRPGDVVLAVSGSGNSVNVVNAVKYARQAHATTIGLVGFDGGVLKDLVDICILVANDSYEQVEDLHLMLGHLMCVCIRRAISTEAYPLPEYLVAESGRLRLNEEVVNAQGSIPRP
jgi:D-sedoheptulose 7-phosphate isomerase